MAKHLIPKILGFLVIMAVVGWYAPTTKAAEPFVDHFVVLDSRSDAVNLMWSTAEGTYAQPVVYYYKSSEDRGTASSNHVEFKSSSEIWIYGLEDNTTYTIWVEYPYNGTTHGTLADYSDYDATQQKIISETFTFNTAKIDLRFLTVDKTYVRPGEKLRIYGLNFGTSQTDNVASLGPRFYQAYYLRRLGDSERYEFPVTSWGSDYIELETPAYNADIEIQDGLLYFNHLVPLQNGGYNGLLHVKVLSDNENVQSDLITNYKGEKLRYLVNAVNFRYNHVLNDINLNREKQTMNSLGAYLREHNLRLDATWSLVLAFANYYGGYSDEEVHQEAAHGPGCVHAFIPEATWKLTADYTRCMAR